MSTPMCGHVLDRCPGHLQRHTHIDVHDSVEPLVPVGDIIPCPTVQDGGAVRKRVNAVGGEERADDGVVCQVTLLHCAFAVRVLDGGLYLVQRYAVTENDVCT